LALKFEGAVTYTRLHDFEQCRLLFKLRHIEKRKEPDSPHFVKGARVHDQLEAFLKKRLGVVPDEAEPLRLKLAWLRRQPGLRTEEAWGYGEDWSPLPVTGYFSKADYIRAKIDALVVGKKVATVIDFKTGKIRPAGEDQVRFYGLLTLLREPKVEAAELQLWFVEHGKTEEYEIVKRVNVEGLRKGYAKRFDTLRNATTFMPTPGLYCKWCSFSKHKAGPCVY
jgi:hypothetical protein